MSRLLAFCLVLFATATPAAAEVCEKILGSGFDRLMKAPLWYHVGDRLLSPLALVLLALAALTATRFPRLRGMALIAGLVTAVHAVTAIGDIVFPDHLLLAAREEGCGSASMTTAIVSSLLAMLLLAAFMRSPDKIARLPS
jgi:hypothetical protein